MAPLTSTRETLQVTGSGTKSCNIVDMAGSRTKGTRNKNAKALTMASVPRAVKRRKSYSNRNRDCCKNVSYA